MAIWFKAFLVASSITLVVVIVAVVIAVTVQATGSVSGGIGAFAGGLSQRFFTFLLSGLLILFVSILLLFRRAQAQRRASI